MKRVSFEVAKAIKKAGYHEICHYYYSDGYDDEDNPEHEFVLCAACIPTFVQDWNDTNKHPEYDKDHKEYWRNVWSAPTYFETWLWLWREKGIQIPVGVDSATIWMPGNDGNMHNRGFFKNDDPEEAIIEAIDYLIENDLIK